MSETLDALVAAMSKLRQGQSGMAGTVIGGTGTMRADFPLTLETAKSLLYSLLRWDQAYGSEQMSADDAIDFTERFFRCFEQSALQCFSNLSNVTDTNSVIEKNGFSYRRMLFHGGHPSGVSNATFDTGIYVVTPALSGYCVFEDED